MSICTEQIKVSSKDRQILRKLASEIAEIASLDVQKEKIELWTKLNNLEKVRPLVWINPMQGQVPWNEIGIEKELLCDTQFCRCLELELRKRIYQWHNFRCDMVIDSTFFCPLVINVDSFGLEEQGNKIFNDNGNGVASHAYVRLINSEKDIEKIKPPHVYYDRIGTENNFNVITDIFNGILHVVKRGQPGIWFAPWDLLTTWYGAQEILMDLAFRPELLKMAMERLVNAWSGILEQYQSQGLLAINNLNWCSGGGTGGPAYTNQLPQKDFDPSHIRTCDLWGSAAAQIFSSVSPEMHREFALEYEIPWLKKFGLTYYGCCEPLHLKVDILREIPNLRKISMSAWADIDKGATNIGTQFVFSWKPNPSFFAAEQWDEKEISEYLRKGISSIKKHNCPLEIILSDVSTIRYDPGRLNSWAIIASKIAEEFQD